jgi:hypothetical protein
MSNHFYDIEDRADAQDGNLALLPVAFSPAKRETVAIRRQSKREVNRLKALLPGGVPRWVRCYQGEPTYIVCFTGKAGTARAPGHRPEYSYIEISKYPFSCQDIGVSASSIGKPLDVDRWGFPPAMGRKNHLGRRIPFTALPEDCRKLVLRDYCELWGLKAGGVV